jgi:hypothetical protein
MLFKPEMIEAIKKGRKTQTRRIQKPNEYMVWRRFGDCVLADGRRKWQVGRTYAICPGRGQKSVGRILITDIRREPLRSILSEEALQEGVVIDVTYALRGGDEFAALVAFRKLWNSINRKPGTRWEDNPDVWVLEFEYRGHD